MLQRNTLLLQFTNKLLQSQSCFCIHLTSGNTYPRGRNFRSTSDIYKASNSGVEQGNVEVGDEHGTNLRDSYCTSTDPTVVKYTKMLHDMREDRKQKELKEQSEIVHLTNFGSIRFDQDNMIKAADGKVAGENMSFENSGSDELNFIDEYFVGTGAERKSECNSITSDCNRATGEVSTVALASDMNYVDSLIFSSVKEEGDQIMTDKSEDFCSSSSSTSEAVSHLNYIDGNYFSDYLYRDADKTETYTNAATCKTVGDKQYGSLLDHAFVPQENYEDDSKDNHAGSPALSEEVPKRKHLNEDVSKTKCLNEEVSKGKHLNEDVSNYEKMQPTNAYQFVIENRLKNYTSGIEPYHRILNEIILLNEKTRYEVVQMVRNSVIYEKDDIVVINKPYGLSIHGGTDSRSSKYILTELLPDLSALLKCDKLHLIHRLDASATGLLLLAKSAEMASILKLKFQQHEVLKAYWAIVKGVPSPSQGVIDIPIAEGVVQGKHRMTLRPDAENYRSNQSNSKRAVTKYQVLSCNGSCALVELRPVTGVKHQLRVHLGLGLSCPILGDHKYSSINKIVPQKLPGDILDRLRIRQSRVRDLPMLLHCRSLKIPDLLDGRMLSVKSHSPKFFRNALKILKLDKRKSATEEKSIDFIDLEAEVRNM